MTTREVQLIVAMGVSGSGKSTFAKALASQSHYHFVDADDFHSEEAKKMMSEGRPLTDEMRRPWMTCLEQHLGKKLLENQSCVLAFSGLRAAHRAQIRLIGFNTRFVFLRVSKATLTSRLANREAHFFNPVLLDSQFDALQDPQAEPDVLCVDADRPLSELLTITEKETWHEAI